MHAYMLIADRLHGSNHTQVHGYTRALPHTHTRRTYTVPEMCARHTSRREKARVSLSVLISHSFPLLTYKGNPTPLSQPASCQPRLAFQAAQGDIALSSNCLHPLRLSAAFLRTTYKKT